MNPNTSKFRVQANHWNCGPAALRHALLCYGQQHAERKLARWAKTDSEGTTELGLNRAALLAGFELRFYTYQTKELATENIRAHINNGRPIIFCVDKWRHWVTAYHTTARHLYLVDSDPFAEELLQRLTWKEARRRIVKWQDSDDVRFDLCVLYKKD